MTADDLIKAAPAIVAVVVALVKILPALAIAFRRRHIGGKTGSLPEIVRYQAPLPWSDYLNERLTGTSPETGLRRKSITVVLIIMAGLSLIEVLYVLIALHTALAAWSIVLSLTVWVIVIAGWAASCRDWRETPTSSPVRFLSVAR